jgi:ubiquinone/menaquinone biosynthesis C-methylase UbiE
MDTFNPAVEKEFWGRQTSEPPGGAEMDALDGDMRLWFPGYPESLRGKRILDLGAGRCPLGVMVAERHAPGMIVSCDIGHHRLRAAAGSMRADGPFQIVCADAYRLPFPDGVFDFVVANSFLHHLPELERAVAEFTRVLKPGGSYIGREPNFNNPVVRTHVFRFSGTWIRKGERISANEYPLRAQRIERAFRAAGCLPDLHYFSRRWKGLVHPLFSIAISVRARRR